MLLQNSSTGAFQVYDISNNVITNSASLGAVGLDWQVMGFGNFGSFGETDMMLRNINTGGASDLVLHNINTGAFEVYDIANNQITGAALLGSVGLDWQLGGFAPVSTGSPGSMGASDSSNAQLVQAMAGFGGGAGAPENL